MQMMVEKQLMNVEEAKNSIGMKIEPEKTEKYSTRFEIREKTKGLADPKIIPLSKETLKEIMIGLFSLKEIKEIEKEKRARRGS